MVATVMERLDAGEVVIGDGSYVFTLEKRGYVQAGKYTPEAACEHPEAVRQLALEFARAGGDVTQTFTYGSTEGEIMTQERVQNITLIQYGTTRCLVKCQKVKEAFQGCWRAANSPRSKSTRQLALLPSRVKPIFFVRGHFLDQPPFM